MKILILNDTSSYHNGCKTVIDVLTSQFSNLDITLKKKIRIRDFTNYDLLIVNGEGTLHDNAKKAKLLLSCIKAAKQQDVKTMVINAVWQNNSIELTKLLQYADYVSVREITSKNEILKHVDINVDINLDLSYFKDVPYEISNSFNIISGNYYKDGRHDPNTGIIKNIGEDGYIDIFNQSWNDVVNRLRHSKLLVTGRHHEMYAACKAECPFIIMEGNTHKNSGLFQTFGVNIPVLPIDASIADIKYAISNVQKFTNEYQTLFRLMKSETEPNFLKKI